MSGTKFKAKVVIKRKSLPTQPIHVRISATPEDGDVGINDTFAPQGSGQGSGTSATQGRITAKAPAKSWPSSPKRKKK